MKGFHIPAPANEDVRMIRNSFIMLMTRKQFIKGIVLARNAGNILMFPLKMTFA